MPDRWEYANEFFKKREKHLLCEIHRRKTAQPQQGIMNHHHHHAHSPLGVNVNVPTFFPFSSRVSISTSNDSDDQSNWCDSPPRGATSLVNGAAAANYNTSVTALSEDNERLRRSNNMLMSELAHMKKLYNDIIYFVQNHVKPVAPSNSYSSSLLLCNTPSATPITSGGNVSMTQRPTNQLLGYYSTNPKQGATQITQPQTYVVNSPTNTSRSSITIVEGPNSNINSCKTKLFGVSLQSKKRVHPDYGSNPETNKARLVLEKDDLGLNLMPPSTC